MVHPKEAINQLGLISQQIKFNSILKLKNQILIDHHDRGIVNYINELIQK